MGRHLTLYDFRDIDLMVKFAAEAADNDDRASTGDVASALGMDDDKQAVGQRLAWMRRFGMFTFDDHTKMWTLSRSGQRIVDAHERAGDLPAVADTPDESLVDVMAHVTSRYRHADPATAHLLRREFAFGTNPASAAYNGSRRKRKR